MNYLTAKVHHLIHTSGFLADLMYGAAFRGKDFWLRFRNRRALRDGVSMEELHEFRNVAASSLLVIGLTNVCNGRCVFCAYPRAADSKQLKFGVMSFPLFKKVVDEWASL